MVLAGAAAILVMAPGLALAWGGCGCGWGYEVHHSYRHYGYGYRGYGYGWRNYGYGYPGYGYAYPPYGYGPALAYAPAPHSTTSCTPYGCAQVRCAAYGGSCIQTGPWYWRH